MNDDFMLYGDMAQRLYFDTAEKLPLIDFHDHLPINDIAADKRFDNIVGLWISSDPYKHRAMRICGVGEKYITGDADDKEKFLKWCEIFPRLVGNPLFDWSVMELARVFDVDIIPSADSAERLYEMTCKRLGEDLSLSTIGLMDKFGVEYCAPCTSLIDNTEPFGALDGRVVPSLRGDDLTVPSKETLSALSNITSVAITDLESYREALKKRISEFHNIGCRFSDHALDAGFTYVPNDGKNHCRFAKIISGEELCMSDRAALFSEILRILCGEYARCGWTIQLHIGAQRKTSTRLRKLAGAAGGYAAIGDRVKICDIVELLDDLEKGEYGLARILLFTLEPSYNAAFSSLSGSFSKDEYPSLVGQGPAWWWCDHATGMREVFDSIASYSVLSEFIGMTTDSRSFLSFSRHEYFRRVFCSYLGEKAERGEITRDEGLLSAIVKKVCYQNAKERIGGKN